MSTSSSAIPHPGAVRTVEPADLEELGGAAAEIQGRSPWELAWDRLRRDRVAIASIIVIVLITLVAIFAPLIAMLVGHASGAQYPYIALNGYGLPIGPSRSFLFGADDLGRDVLVRVAYGARISLIAGVVASGLAVIFGGIVGMVAGYFGTVVDTTLSRFMDVILSFPLLLFAIALVSIVGPSLGVTIAVIAFFSWAVVGRIIRGQTLSLREKEFVEAARSLGASDLRIMFVDILPNLVAPLLVYTTLLIPASIVFEASLSFLGLGVVPPTPSWGNMLSDAEPYYKVAWWFIIFPGGALLLTTLAFNLLGDSVRDALDPRYARLFKA
jgi:peptide/nickel transport system permease protein